MEDTIGRKGGVELAVRGLGILRKNLYPEHVLDMLLHRFVTRAVVGNDTRPSTGAKQQELPKHYFKIP